jgi:hypothetical protein
VINPSTFGMDAAKDSSVERFPNKINECLHPATRHFAGT